MLYDPDDPNQALYKGNLLQRQKLIRVILIGKFDSGRTIQQSISDPRGLCLDRFYDAVSAMRKAFPIVSIQRVYLN